MSAVDVIRRRGRKYNLIRRGVATIVDGIATPAADVITPILAYHQPMTAKDLRNLPQGQNAGEWRNVWTEYAAKLTDKIDLNGIPYTVQRIALWQDGPFYILNVNYTEDVLT